MAFDPTLGRWMQQDPAGYVDGLSLYQPWLGSPTSRLDPLGLAAAATQPTTQPNRTPGVRVRYSVTWHVCVPVVHSWLDIVDDKGRRHTWSGYPDPKTKVIKPIRNQETDFNDTSGGSVQVEVPPGMTLKQFIDALDRAAKNLPGRNFAKFPDARSGKEGNCHTCTVQTIECAGGKVPPVDPRGFNPRLEPSTNWPKIPPDPSAEDWPPFPG